MKIRRVIALTAVVMAMVAETASGQWVRQESGTTSMLTDIVMLDAATAIAVGRNREVLRTTNSGETWVNITAHLSFTYPWSAVSFFDSAHGSVLSDNGGVMTTWSGLKTWRVGIIPGARKCFSLLQTGPGRIVVGADSGWVYSTRDTAATWTAEKISSWPIRSLLMYRGPTTQNVTMYALTPYTLCTQSVFPVASWSEVVLDGFRGLGSEARDAEYCNGGGAGFIVGVQGDLRAAPAILRRRLSDTQWTNVASGVHRDGVFLGVSAPSERVIYACGSGGMIYRSANGGDTWLDQSVTTTRNINAVSFYDENRGVAVGDSGLILFTTNGGITGIGRSAGPGPKTFSLAQNYPNPFNPSTTIGYTIPEDAAGPATLSVVDVLGRTAAVLVDEVQRPGPHEILWNAAGVPSGMYVYRLRVGVYSAARRLMIVK